MVVKPIHGLIKNLSKKDKGVVENLVAKMKDSEELTRRVCVYLASQIGQDEIEHFIELDSDMKIQACTNYLVIALTSGDVKRKELEIFIK